MTMVTDQLYQWGGVPVGAPARYTGWWGVDTWFVDFDHGSDSNGGAQPTEAKKYLQSAIDASALGDVIYVRNRDQDITSTDPEAITPESTTNWSIAEAKTHLSIIGAANVSHIPTQEGQYAVYLKGQSGANTTAVMDWQGAFGLIENLAFHRGGSTAGGLLALTGNSTSLRALGTVVNNCLFRYANHTLGALYNLDNWFVTVYGCTFHNDRFGIYVHGSNTTIRRQHIERCLFRNQTATNVDTNIHMQGSSTQDVVIKDCVFACNTPNYSGGSNKFINISNAATGIVSGCQFPIDTNEGTTSMEINGLDAVACWQAVTTTVADPTWGLAT